jgi:hypothetical protein
MRLCAQRTRRAMSLVGIPEPEQAAICRTVAAVLHLGNVAFEDGAEESSRVAPGGPAPAHLAAAAKLLGVHADGLARALTTRTRHTTDGARACVWQGLAPVLPYSPRLCSRSPALMLGGAMLIWCFAFVSHTRMRLGHQSAAAAALSSAPTHLLSARVCWVCYWVVPAREIKLCLFCFRSDPTAWSSKGSGV